MYAMEHHIAFLDEVVELAWITKPLLTRPTPRLIKDLTKVRRVTLQSPSPRSPILLAARLSNPLSATDVVRLVTLGRTALTIQLAFKQTNSSLASYVLEFCFEDTTPKKFAVAGTVNGARVTTILRDTGCSCIIVSEEALPDVDDVPKCNL